jgi:hypothetical protein
VLAAGGLVQNAALVGGRRPPHALARAKEITDAAGEDLRQAEVLVRAIADATRARRGDVDGLRRAVGSRWWHPAPRPPPSSASPRRCAGPRSNGTASRRTRRSSAPGVRRRGVASAGQAAGSPV